MDLNKYWSEVRRVAEQLPIEPVYYLMSLDNSDKGTNAGRVFAIVAAKEAARRLVENTHRLATESEIERFHAEEKRQNQELADIEYKRKQQFGLPQELQALVSMAVASVMPAADGKPKLKETK